MYAIIETGGLQFRVEPGLRLTVPRLKVEEGGNVVFDRVLLFSSEGGVVVGRPSIDAASVEARVLRHMRGPKIEVYHRKRRKGHEKKTGHRQELTEIEIAAIKGS
ncbi:50S ribosomal protein L21 [Candidatus Fermentibacteria bacterium]|nr:50S ribosomal protein L21 [Candidatus Fermentibacteria bacterium]